MQDVPEIKTAFTSRSDRGINSAGGALLRARFRCRPAESLLGLAGSEQRGGVRMPHDLVALLEAPESKKAAFCRVKASSTPHQ